MISSPSEKGIIMIGGGGMNQKMKPSSYILELSGDFEETLEWKILEQKLQYTRTSHISFSISNDIAASVTMKSIGGS